MSEAVFDFKAIRDAMHGEILGEVIKPKRRPCAKCNDCRTVPDASGNAVPCPECNAGGDYIL